MTLSDLAIERPVLTWMMTLALIVFGVLGYSRLGVEHFPNMDFPVVSVTAVLEGASPEAMEEDVTDVIEEQLNSISGIRSLRSTTTQGFTSISVEFALGRDLDVAAEDVRAQVARARLRLPAEVEPPVVSKRSMGDFPVLWIPFQTSRSQTDSSEYIRRHVKPLLETIPGVGGINIFGNANRSIRIWLDGDALRARGLAAADVLAALRREHVEIPGGIIEGQRIEWSVKTDAEFSSTRELERLVVSYHAGSPVYLVDVARVEDGESDVRSLARFNGQPTIGVGIMKQSGANTVAIVDEAIRRLEELRPLLPEGISLNERGYIDMSTSIREAVAETKFALLFGGLLAVLVVFVFLRRVRPTLIVAAAIPLSLTATFGLVWLSGATLNTMTLLGMTLAIGVVIDDAIIVLESIERQRELGKSPREAASVGTRQITFAAAAATISVAAVFLPVVFVEGILGNFLGEFGLTVAGSVVISLFVALTLTPMLAARMPPPAVRKHGSIYHRLEQGFARLESSYARLLDWSLAHRGATLGIAAASIVAAFLFARGLDAEFFPPSDQGILMGFIEAPPGTTLEATLEYLKRDEDWFLSQPEVWGLFSALGTGGNSQREAAPNHGMMFASLTPPSERDRSSLELVSDARKVLSQVPGRTLAVYDPSTMSGGGMSRRQFEILLRGNLALSELDSLADVLIRGLQTKGGFVDLEKSLKLGLPEVRVVPDRERAAALGVDAQSIAQTVQMMIGGVDVGVFKEGGQRFDIRMRLEKGDRDNPAEIESLYVRANDGEVIELRNVVHIETGAAPSSITRSNRQRSVAISGNLEGKTIGVAMADAWAVAREVLPEGVTISPSGQAEAMQESAAQFGVAILLGLLVIYMVLAAQFESFVHPLTVMLAVPLAMVGALGGLWLASWFMLGMTFNIFSMIGIILLFGLVTKNSILVVDYANQLRGEGMNKVEAMRAAAPVRMRPVLMTGLSMIFGVLPAALGLGPGAETRAPMAIATATGMLSSMLLTLLVIPVFYLVIDDGVEALKARVRRLLGSARPAPESAS